ncbi:protein serine/threonine phosphatase [Sulfurifustis variabilis]|uniref:Protein serine/threonine phosphatase n=1 Tax=Sulfurifustis variabilis TaxID=1675686 RepID=A0A1B4V8H8_9GAMM|nr:bifunctional protein-serine/threonine kinase/phosphatase [Sulfurifustis variabilis]BAU48942.1 protein serine/threonine phosphatase [Sulfurifustis variabilis]
MQLFLDTGHSERTPRQEPPRGTCLEIVPETGRDGGRGALLACAEGIADRPEAEKAARIAITALADSYYAAPEGWALRQALEESVRAAHQAVLAGGERGRAAVFAALVLRGRRWLAAHAGHARIWLFRDHELRLLTRDHLIPRPRRRPEIAKALGLASEIDAEYHSGELAEGDVFLLTTPGAHDALDAARMRGVLEADAGAEHIAETLATRAQEAGAPGYAGVCAVRVEKLPPESIADTRESVADLAFVEPPEVGTIIDGFRVDKLVYRSRRYRIYKAADTENGATVALKFPDPSCREDPEYARSFLREEWIGRRVDNAHLVKALRPRPGRRRALYVVMEYHEGEPLAKRIRRKGGLPVEEALRLAEQMLEALGALHGHGVIHRDLRVNHLLYDKAHRRLLLLGLGESRVEALKEGADGSATSAWSYQAPELFEGKAVSERTDIYSAGVTLYRMITGEYPYGRIRAPRWEDRAYRSMNEWKPDVPEALDAVVRRACEVNPSERYASVAQFASALARVGAELSGNRYETRPHGERETSDGSRWTWVVLASLLAGLVAYLAVALR